MRFFALKSTAACASASGASVTEQPELNGCFGCCNSVLSNIATWCLLSLVVTNFDADNETAPRPRSA